MNKGIFFRFIVGGLCFVLSMPVNAQALKGLKSLKKNKFEEAYQAFQSGLTNPKEIPVAYYGLALIYSTPTYPNYNIDTAYANIGRAETTFRKLDYKVKGKLSKKMTLADIRKAKKGISAKAYEKYTETNTLEGWNYFLENYHKPGYKLEKNAQIQRNTIAYETAKATGTYEALGEMFNKYRKSLARKSPKILRKVEKDLLELYMAANGWESFEHFSEDYPSHTFVKDSVHYDLAYLDESDDIIGMFEMHKKYKNSSFSTVIGDYLASSIPTNGNMEECEQFINLLPNHADGQNIWEKYYKLYRQKNPRFKNILEFEEKYPDNPIADIILNDKTHFAEKRFNIVMEKGDPRGYKQFINQFPNYPKVKEIEDLYFGKVMDNFDGEELYKVIEFEEKNPSIVKQARWTGIKKEALNNYFDNLEQVDKRGEILIAIQKYPDHSQIGEAWKTYYQRYKDEVGGDEEALDQFLEKYTEFPYPELIVQDKKKIIEDEFDMTLASGSWRDLMNLAQENETHPRVAEIWKTGLDKFLEKKPTYRELRACKIKYTNAPFLNKLEELIKKAKTEYTPSKTDEKLKPKSKEGFFGLINSSYNEYLPVISTDGKSMYFCRKMKSEDIFVSTMKNGQWQEAKPIIELNNIGYVNIAPLTLSSDGNKMILFLDGRLAQTNKTVDGWSEPVEMPRTFNEKSWQADAVYSADGKVILFARRDFGSGELYISHLEPDGSWSDATKMPSPINTDSDERSPFLHPDMKTLYFSSARSGGYGKLDVYVTERIGDGWDKWTEPVNLGKEVNSENNDWGFRVMTDGKRGYFTEQSEGESDIFLTNLEKEHQAESITSVSGTVKDKKGNGIGAQIVWTLLETNEEVQVTSSDPEDGSFYATLPQKGLYGYTIEKKGYFPIAGNVEVKEESFNFVLDKELVLVTIEESKAENLSLPLNNLFFETGKYAIKNTSHVALKRLNDWVKEHDLSIDIIGYTDNVGNNQSNLLLSENRANAVKEYLVSLGGDASLIFTTGMGAKNPVEPNNTKSGRDANRRVEIKLK